MKIVYFLATPQNFAGSQRATATLAANLPPDVEPCALFTGEGRAVDAFRDWGVPTHVLPAPRALGLYDKQILRKSRMEQALIFVRDVAPYTLALQRFLRRSRADVVHCESARGVLLIGLAARLCGIPVVWHLQGENILALHPHLNRVASLFTTRLVRCAAGVGASLAARLPGDVIPYGIDVRRRGPAAGVREQCDALLRERGMNPASCFRFITTASLVPFKGLQHLVDAVAALLREDPGLSGRLAWFILGDARTPATKKFRDFLAGRIQENGLERNVFWVGWQSDAMAWMDATDLVVVPTVLREPFQYPGEPAVELFCTEGLPLAILEAMHAGRPVVASRVAGVPEAVVEGHTGLLVPPGSADALRRALGEMVSSPARRAEMGRAARIGAQRFTAQRMATDFAGVYRRLVGRAPSPASAPALT